MDANLTDREPHVNFKQQPISRPSDVSPCPSPLPSTEPESLGDDQIESEDSVEEQADDNITRKHAKVTIATGKANKTRMVMGKRQRCASRTYEEQLPETKLIAKHLSAHQPHENHYLGLLFTRGYSR